MNKKAINTLKSLKDYYNDKNEDSYVGFDKDDNEALDLAIKALEVVKGIEDAYMSELLKTPTERNVPISDPCDGCQYELNSTNGNPCYSCGKYKLTEQQPCDDECIEKNEPIRRIEVRRDITIDGEDEDDEWIRGYNEGIDDAIACIKSVPPITPSRPKGRWISHIEHCKKLGLKLSGLGAYEWCSKCDCGVDIIEFYSIHYNFCPCCGADMRGDKNE